jgi:hypothetical protein
MHALKCIVSVEKGHISFHTVLSMTINSFVQESLFIPGYFSHKWSNVITFLVLLMEVKETDGCEETCSGVY